MIFNSWVQKIGILFFATILITSTSSTQAQSIAVEAYVGSISGDEIDQGDTLIFSCTIYNLSNSSIFVNAMNATFIELLGQSSVRDPKRHNYQNIYDNKLIRNHEIFSDNFKSKIDLNPGKYNVSVGFAISNGTETNSALWEYKFGVVNQTVEIFGTSQSVNIARGIGYFLLGITGLIVLYYIYSKFK